MLCHFKHYVDPFFSALQLQGTYDAGDSNVFCTEFILIVTDKLQMFWWNGVASNDNQTLVKDKWLTDIQHIAT